MGKCIFGTIFAQISRNALRNHNSHKKLARYEAQSSVSWIKKRSVSHVCLLSGRVDTAPQVFWGSFFAPNGRNPLRNSNNFPKNNTQNRGERHKIMGAIINTLNITMGCDKPTQIFHNITNDVIVVSHSFHLYNNLKIQNISKMMVLPMDFFMKLFYWCVRGHIVWFLASK